MKLVKKVSRLKAASLNVFREGTKGMTTYSERARLNETLENAFLKSFNARCQSHRILKLDPETREYEYITSSDIIPRPFTTLDGEYRLPDLVLRRTDSTDDCAQFHPLTALVNFRVHGTPIEEASLSFIRRDYYKQSPVSQFLPLYRPEQIFGINRDAFHLYRQIEELGLSVILIGFQNHTKKQLKAQFAGKIVQCTITSTPSGGSGKPISNTHFDSFSSAQDFFESEFRLNRNILDSVESDVKNAFDPMPW